MGKRILAKDRIGTIVREFEIVDYKRENNRTYFYVKCPACGNKKWMRADSLNNPKVKSCGCFNVENNYLKAKDITNKRFNRLVALVPTEQRDKFTGSVIWKCLCDCGNIVNVSYDSLAMNRVQSCGCLQKETMKKNMQKAILVRNKYRVASTDILALERAKKIQAGVNFNKTKGWDASITFQGKSYHLGYFDNYEDALKVRKHAEHKLFDEFLEWYYSKNKE